MATPTPEEMLNAEEVIALRDAFDNPRFKSGFTKVFRFDAKYHNETMSNEALLPVINTGRIVAAAACARFATEILNTVAIRMKALIKQ